MVSMLQQWRWTYRREIFLLIFAIDSIRALKLLEMLAHTQQDALAF